MVLSVGCTLESPKKPDTTEGWGQPQEPVWSLSGWSRKTFKCPPGDSQGQPQAVNCFLEKPPPTLGASIQHLSPPGPGTHLVPSAICNFSFFA